MTINPFAMAMQQKMQQHVMKVMDKYMGASDARYAAAPRRALHEEMAQYFADIRDGKAEVPDAMAEAMCMAAMQAVIAYMGKHEEMKMQLGECAATGELMTQQSEQHKKFKSIVEELREETGDQRKRNIIDEKFSDLTTDEKNLLMHLSKDYSKRSRARDLHVSEEELARMKKNLESKVK